MRKCRGGKSLVKLLRPRFGQTSDTIRQNRKALQDTLHRRILSRMLKRKSSRVNGELFVGRGRAPDSRDAGVGAGLLGAVFRRRYGHGARDPQGTAKTLGVAAHTKLNSEIVDELQAFLSLTKAIAGNFESGVFETASFLCVAIDSRHFRSPTLGAKRSFVDLFSGICSRRVWIDTPLSTCLATPPEQNGAFFAWELPPVSLCSFYLLYLSPWWTVHARPEVQKSDTDKNKLQHPGGHSGMATLKPLNRVAKRTDQRTLK